MSFDFFFSALGSFWLNDTSYGSPAKYVHCHGTAQSALTHTGWVFSQDSLVAHWRPPANFTGRVRYTFFLKKLGRL